MTRPRVFESPQQLEERFIAFLDKCQDEVKVPTIIGFSLFLNINRDTFYRYKDFNEYTDTIKRIEDLLEEASLQAMFQAKNPAAHIFYLKNKFGYSDKQADVGSVTINNYKLPEVTAEINRRLQEIKRLEEIEGGKTL